MPFTPFPIETDPDALYAEAVSFLQDVTDGLWQPADGNLDDWILRATAAMAAEVRDVAADIPGEIFRVYGTDLIGLPPVPAAPAVAQLSLTVNAPAAVTLPAGTTFGIDGPDGSSYGFQMADQDLPISAGTTTVALTTWAMEPGSDPNGITPAAGVAYVIDAVAFITGVVLTAPVAGGMDAETDSDYQDRLSDALRLLSPAPILAPDFAVMALTVDGVGRAAAIDNYEPGPPINTSAERTVTVAVADDTGNPCSTTVKQNVFNLLDGAREVNFVVHVIDPNYVTVNVTYTVAMVKGFVASDVVARCNDALTQRLDPGLFSQPLTGDVAGYWTVQSAVRYLDVAAVLLSVDGVDHVVSLTLNGSSADVTLPPPAGLPRPGTLTGTAT